MRIYNDNKDPSQKTIQSCSYCRDPEHNATDCPHVATDWASFQRFEIPSIDPANWTNNPKPKQQGQAWYHQTNQASWFKSPSGWSKWYAECEKAHEKQVKAAVRAANSTTGKARRQPKCGFCGSLHHNRRNCEQMDALVAKAITANREWRKQFHAAFVGRLGLSEGALIQVTIGNSWNNDNNQVKTGIVTKVNWDELHMGCDSNYTSHPNRWKAALAHELQQIVKLEVMVDGKRINVSLGDDLVKKLGLDSLISNRSVWNNVKSIDVISPAENLKAEEWIDDAHEDAMRFITKRRSKEQLKDKGFVGLVDKWEKKSKDNT